MKPHANQHTQFQNNIMTQPHYFTVRVLAFIIILTGFLDQSRGQDLHWSADGKQGWFEQPDDSGNIQLHFVDAEN